ncbi:MAG: shikimate dehydrogenase [Roseofilum sp. SBFL]|uniref:shikimate dehydrogenase n=1 Tax=unclassified Roseofilum TaxID=2620099 RepID=UPI001B19AC9C|nr:MULTISPECIES: shikimate dehydrogenase [unclassified Roseofilum]MBP0013677.1 shikimate dehydrogenase [Roseofilum sp. SID3]MBP0023483.1 shikimate dehydrogenase [Roseofilum sp. SID2]MBP0037209.1 shikimate dehydrogenase [Roseofilum sp. SID1]MBP0040948.1 shikimate dehydrogenase [Roseofilum sp. SBFL]
MQEIQGTTRLLGIIGDPIKHSRSPVMQNAALSHLGADYVYVPFPVTQDQLEVVLQGFQAVGVVGFNVTIPHKRAIMPYLSQISPVAQAVGAVNTVWRTERGWEGTNTDVLGFIAPLKEEHQKWSNAQVVILGNGGSARAVVAGCLELGVERLHVVGRNLERLQAFQQSWSSPVMIHQWPELPDLLSETTVLVNTTPIGMSPNVNETPVDRELLARLPQGAILYDLIYNPRPTRFLQLGREIDRLTIDGTEMLVQQGAAALQLWLDEPTPVGVMRQALLDAL